MRIIWLSNDPNNIDFKCPYCKSSHEWDEDNLYDWTWELVGCSKCSKTFKVKRRVTYTYEVKE